MLLIQKKWWHVRNIMARHSCRKCWSRNPRGPREYEYLQQRSSETRFGTIIQLRMARTLLLFANRLPLKDFWRSKDLVITCKSSGLYGRCSRTSHRNFYNKSLHIVARSGRALSWRNITLLDSMPRQRFLIVVCQFL